MRIILLIGITASGKTTLGRLLAKSLNYSFIDIDEKIAERTSMSVRVFYEKNGKRIFQELEAVLLKECLEIEITTKKGLVISCGGGLIENTIALSILKENPKLQIFFLDNKPKILFNRVLKKAKKQHSFPSFLKVPSSKNLSSQIRYARMKFLIIYKRRMKLLKTITCLKLKTKGLSTKKIIKIIMKKKLF